MWTYRECHDITLLLGVESPLYPGDTAFARVVPERGGEPNQLVMGTHNGTHLDAPAHFLPGRDRLDAFPVGYFVRPARVVETWGTDFVTAEDLAEVSLEPGEALLCKTGNSRRGLVSSGEFREDFVALAGEAAQWCVDQGVPLVGHDYITVDPYGDEAARAHHLLLGNGIPILEGINLATVAPGQYLLAALPLRLGPADGGPCRAVLLR